MTPPIVIKKYSNRRLYDTQDSRYITLDELAAKVRGGTDVAVVDATSGDDLTRATLTQILMEERGAARMLPAEVLATLIRLGDQPLAEFLEHYVAAALLLYMQHAQGGESSSSFRALPGKPFAGDHPVARMWALMAPGTRTGMGAAPWPPAPWPQGQLRGEQAPDEPRPETLGELADEMAALRRELDELKRMVLERQESPRRSASRRRKNSTRP